MKKLIFRTTKETSFFRASRIKGSRVTELLLRLIPPLHRKYMAIQQRKFEKLMRETYAPTINRLFHQGSDK